MFSLSNLTRGGTVTCRDNWFRSQNVNGNRCGQLFWQEHHPGVGEIDGPYIDIHIDLDLRMLIIGMYVYNFYIK